MDFSLRSLFDSIRRVDSGLIFNVKFRYPFIKFYMNDDAFCFLILKQGSLNINVYHISYSFICESSELKEQLRAHVFSYLDIDLEGAYKSRVVCLERAGRLNLADALGRSYSMTGSYSVNESNNSFSYTCNACGVWSINLCRCSQ